MGEIKSCGICWSGHWKNNHSVIRWECQFTAKLPWLSLHIITGKKGLLLIIIFTIVFLNVYNGLIKVIILGWNDLKFKVFLIKDEKIIFFNSAFPQVTAVWDAVDKTMNPSFVWFINYFSKHSKKKFKTFWAMALKCV